MFRQLSTGPDRSTLRNPLTSTLKWTRKEGPRREPHRTGLSGCTLSDSIGSDRLATLRQQTPSLVSSSVARLIVHLSRGLRPDIAIAVLIRKRRLVLNSKPCPECAS